MTSTSFRDTASSLGWSRRDPDIPVRTSNNNSSTPFLSRLQSFNPFGQGGGGYVQLPTHEAPPETRPRDEQDEEGWFSLTRWDRMLIFAGCNLGALACFAICICFIIFPPLMMKPRKFAILWSVGSALFLASWAVLMGPIQYAKHLFSGPRLPFTAAYFGSIALTLYFAVGLQSTLLTLISSVIQLAALIWYLVSYFPMGSTGLQYAARFGAGRVTSLFSD